LIKLQTKGIHTVHSTHHDKCVLFSGSNDAHKNTINYLSVHDNKILREFSGHLGQVTDISVSPVDDTFLSSSVDGTVRLWDIGQSGNPLGEMRLPPNLEGSPIAAFDSTGLVFGVSAKMANDEGHVSALNRHITFLFQLLDLIFINRQFESAFSSSMQEIAAAHFRR
jgi:COMPASS component SWD2